jgi:uncharacterized protein YecE (DUF72 family)
MMKVARQDLLGALRCVALAQRRFVGQRFGVLAARVHKARHIGMTPAVVFDHELLHETLVQRQQLENLQAHVISGPGREALLRGFGAARGRLMQLGLLLFQFPPYFTRRSANLDYLASLPERMPGARIAIEFRHVSWLAEGEARTATLKFLGERGFALVAVDTPPATIPSFLEATGPDAYVRFHGRNRDNWYRRDISPTERYKYLCSERELAEWADRLRRLGERGVSRAFVIFNNCYANFGIMNATTMAQILKR